MRVLVTGGAGFIGSHIVDALVEAGHDVAIVDDLSTGSRRNLNPEARCYEVSITEVDALREIFSREKPELVNHHEPRRECLSLLERPAGFVDSDEYVVLGNQQVILDVIHGIHRAGPIILRIDAHAAELVELCADR